MSLICCHYSLFRACLSLAVSLSLFVLAPLLYLFLPHLRIFATVLVLCAFVFPISIYILPLVYIFFLLFVSLSHHAFSFPPLVAFSSGSYIFALSLRTICYLSPFYDLSTLSLSLSGLFSFRSNRARWELLLGLSRAVGPDHTDARVPEHSTLCCALAAEAGQNTTPCAVFWRRGRARTQHKELCSGGGGGPEHSTVCCVPVAGGPEVFFRPEALLPDAE